MIEMESKVKVVNNIEIPALGLGTFKLLGDLCVEAIKDALDIGYRHIDTAQFYGNEEEVGTGIKKSTVSRNDIWLTTKVWHDSLSAADLTKTFEDSLKKLKTDYVDLLLIHWPSTTGVPLEESLEAMTKLKEAGKAANIGVSNFPPAMFEQAMELANIVCNQVEYHPFLSQDTLLKMAVESNMFFTAYSPIGQGEVFKNDLLVNIAEKYNKNAAQVALRWLLQQGNVLAIPRSSKHENRKSNFDVFDFELNEEEMAQIFKISSVTQKRMVNPDFAPAW